MMLLAVCHSKGAGWEQVDDVSTVSDLRATQGNLVWAEADVTGLSPEDIEVIAEEFDLHPLAVEDAIHLRQRPKVDAYENHLFFVFHELDEIEGQLEAVQLSCFIGERYVLTIHGGAGRVLDEAKKRWEELEDEADHPGHLLHTLLDVVVDDYGGIAQRLEDEVELLEEVVLAQPDVRVQTQIYSLKQRTSRLRRYSLPLSRVLEWATDDGKRHLPDITHHQFRDVHDHVLRMVDQIRSIDDLSQAVLDLTQGEHTRSLNEINKKLSAWAAIFAVSTVIAGIYGMNFVLVPKDQTLAGFWFALGLMGVMSLGLYLYFKRKDWL
jgi:magnesium transporter